ncbi:MAG: hypothetical protein IJD48_03510 [Clostridia bacterium]|nr:hypothetical protein [Clostridia bacterium]
MISFEKSILRNNQFTSLCNEQQNCNSFLFESSDNVFLENFAFCFAKFLMCKGEKQPCNTCIDCQKVSLLSHADVTIYPKSNKSILVEDVKDLIQNINLTPIEGDKKIFIFKNFSTANVQSQNKLLKILEEPPKNAYIILCVSNINKVLPTVLSRCKKYRLLPLTDDQMIEYLSATQIDSKNFKTILDFAGGSLEKALSFNDDSCFILAFDACMDALINMKDSKTMLKYSVPFSKDRKIFECALDIFEILFRDMLMIRFSKQNLVKNKNLISQISALALSFDADAIDKIIKRLYFIKQQMLFNCNYVFLVDNLLLYILEVKFLCNKK